MKSAVLILLASTLLAASLWFFSESGGRFVAKDYLGGFLHMVVGFTTIRHGVDLARLSVLARSSP